MNILLNGYFDKNFGDDAMQEIIVKHFKEHNFYVNCPCREMLAHLTKYDNVFTECGGVKLDMFLNVIGTGFIYNNKFAKLDKIHKILTGKGQKYPKRALINCSFENFGSKAEAALAKYDLNKYDFITCRDAVSFEHLKGNAKTSRVFNYSDMVFSGDYVYESSREYLGIAPVSRVNNPTNYDYYKELAKFADGYIERENKKVRLFAFDAGYENDILAVMTVKNMMKNSHMAEIIAYNSDTQRFAKEISECEYLICSRFHSVVLGVMNNLKVIAVYDNEKIRRICAEYNIMGIEKSDFTGEKLMKNIAEYKHYTADFSNSEKHIKALAEFMVE